uniref:Uncharacterized protein n=1 Tax=Cacopsylla melanoneura TaxID=428564 RepID=A0A8D8QEW9_9HEMI
MATLQVMLCLLGTVLVAVLAVDLEGFTTISPVVKQPTTPKLSVAQNLNKAAMECQSKQGVNQAFMGLLSTKNIPTNEKMRCFLLCVYETLGLVQDNKFQATNAKLMATQRFSGEELKKANHLIDTCNKTLSGPMEPNPKEFCLMGRLVRTCFKEEGDKISFFPKA